MLPSHMLVVGSGQLSNITRASCFVSGVDDVSYNALS